MPRSVAHLALCFALAQQFDLPPSAISGQAALSTSMPALAKQVLAGKRERLDLQAIRLMSRRLQKGSRLVAVLSVIKSPDRQINYGTGKVVRIETIHDAGKPLEIKWFGESYLDLPVSH